MKTPLALLDAPANAEVPVFTDEGGDASAQPTKKARKGKGNATPAPLPPSMHVSSRSFTACLKSTKLTYGLKHFPDTFTGTLHYMTPMDWAVGQHL